MNCAHIKIYFLNLPFKRYERVIDYQAKLCLQIMNQHTFLMICMLKYHLQFQCLGIDQLSNKETMQPFNHQDNIYFNIFCHQ